MGLSSSACGPQPCGPPPPLPASVARPPHCPLLCPPACSGLPTNVTEDAVAQFFGTIGMVKMDKKTKRPKVGAAPAGTAADRPPRCAACGRHACVAGLLATPADR